MKQPPLIINGKVLKRPPLTINGKPNLSDDFFNYYREVQRVRRRSSRVSVKSDALRYYSSKGRVECSSCMCMDSNALTLHRIGGGENGDQRTGWNLYSWLKENNYPSGYKTLCINHNWIEAGRGSNYALKREVLKHYSRKGRVECVLCSWKDIRVLSLDHVLGGGRKHMESLGIQRASKFYEWLKMNDYPSDPPLQVLCMNCQFIKATQNFEW